MRLSSTERSGCNWPRYLVGPSILADLLATPGWTVWRKVMKDAGAFSCACTSADGGGGKQARSANADTTRWANLEVTRPGGRVYFFGRFEFTWTSKELRR